MKDKPNGLSFFFEKTMILFIYYKFRKRGIKMLTIRNIGTFTGTELEARDLGFNLSSGYHKEFSIHININSSRSVTLVKESDSSNFNLEEEFIEQKMKKLIKNEEVSK
jgi:hypothetical protein